MQNMPAPEPSSHTTIAQRSVDLVYASEEDASVRAELLPRFASRQVRCVPMPKDTIPDLGSESLVVTYLSDETLTRFIAHVKGREVTFGVLPHPKLLLGRRAFGVAGRLEHAVHDVLDAADPVSLDVLTCNGAPVLDSVVIGDVSPLAQAPMIEPLYVRIWRMLRDLRAARAVRLRRFVLTTEGQNSLETAALAIVALDHRHRWCALAGLRRWSDCDHTALCDQ